METVANLKQYGGLVSAFRKRNPGLHTNCFLLPAKIQQYIDRQGLWFIDHEDQLLFISDEFDYYNLYYFLPQHRIYKTISPAFNLEKPILLELADQESAWEEKYLAISEFWTRSGFKEFASFQRMKAKTGDRFLQGGDGSTVDTTDLSIRYADEEFIPKIMSFWRDYLPVIGNTFPNGNEMDEQVEQKRIMIVVDRSNQLAATMHFIPQGDTCTVKHVVVSERYRRRGLARAMYQTYFQEHPEFKTCQLWVESTNIGAIRLYESLGFVKDGLVARQYLYHINEN